MGRRRAFSPEERELRLVPVEKSSAAATSEVSSEKPEEEQAPPSDEERVSKNYFVPILKASNEEQTITGVVLEPETVDAQGDIYDADVIRRAAFKFLAAFNRPRKGTKLGFMHKNFQPDFELYESFIAPMDLVINNVVIKAGSWIITVHVLNPEYWQMVKSGKITGFSVGGTATVKKLAA